MVYLIVYNLCNYLRRLFINIFIYSNSLFDNYEPGYLACLYISLYNCYFICLLPSRANKLYNHYYYASRKYVQLFFIKKILLTRQNTSYFIFRGLGRSQSILYNTKTLFVYCKIDLATVINK